MNIVAEQITYLIKNGLETATYFKYILQFSKPNLIRPIPFKRIRAAGLYKKSKLVWDKLTDVFIRHNLDITAYCKYLIEELKFSDKGDLSRIIDPNILRRYCAYLESCRKTEYAYKQFVNTVDWLSDFCIRENIRDAVVCFKTLIHTRKLSTFYMCGKISRYYLAAIKDFDKIIIKLDSMSRNDLSDIQNRYEIYNTEINRACLRYTRHKANPFQELNNAIDQKIQKNQVI